MARLLTRLDDGWQLYAELTGRRPTPFKQLDGKPALVAVPNTDASAMLKLRRDHGGEKWLRRFIAQLVASPQVLKTLPDL